MTQEEETVQVGPDNTNPGAGAGTPPGLAIGVIGHSPGMRMSVRLNLPIEAGSVPAVRRLLRTALSIIRVDVASGDDLEIALTEACANVVKHADGAEKFEVHLDVDDHRCAIEVRDDGPGFDPDVADDGTPDESGESGRGLFLIRALSENVRLHSTPRRGSLIHFEKSFA